MNYRYKWIYGLKGEKYYWSKIERESEIMFIKMWYLCIDEWYFVLFVFLKGIGGIFCNIYIGKDMYIFNGYFVISFYYID